MLHLINRADQRDQGAAEFVDSYSKTIAAICRRLEALERGANDLPAAPVDDTPVANALLRAEAALADIAEGLPDLPVEGFELIEWSETRCAKKALATIRPVMKEHGIRTSEFPPAVPAPGENLATPPAPEPGEVGELLTNNGVFKGAHGIEGLLSADAFWEQQPYGTRLYYGDGIADYLHRGVLRSVATLLQRLATPAYLVVGRPPEGFLDLLKSQPGEVQICSAGVSIEPLGDAPHPTFQDAIRLAEGCHDYLGGYTGAEGEAWHGAIDTVVGVLKKAAVGPWDSQLKAVYGVGSEAQADELDP
jgi:hypothetical protein